jgi:predicted MFS family arabinose efflux permease
MAGSKNAVWRVVAVFVTVVGIFALVGSYFTFNTLRKAERSAVESRFDLAAARVSAVVERASSYGLSLPSQVTLPDLLTREASLDPTIRSVDIVDGKGFVVFSSDRVRSGLDVTREKSFLVERLIRDDLGKALGKAQVRFDGTLLDGATDRLVYLLLEAAFIALLLGCLVTIVGGYWLVRQFDRTVALPPGLLAGKKFNPLYFGVRGTLSIIATIGLCASLGFIAAQALQIGKAEIVPELEKRAQSVGRSSAALIEYALGLGIPIDGLQGVQPYFDGLRNTSPEIATIALVDTQSRVVFLSGPTLASDAAPKLVEPVLSSDKKIAEIRIAIDSEVVANTLRATMVDIGFLGIVSLLIALETLALLVGSKASRDLADIEVRANAARLAPGMQQTLRHSNSAVSVVRPPLFLFMLAEELTRPFLPSFSRALVPEGALYANLLGSLPLVAFLAIVALTQIPFASASQRIGRKEGFVIGGLFAAVGFALCAFASDLSVFTGARVLTAIGFSLVFVSAQGQVIDGSTMGDRASSLAIFIRAIVVAGLCGPPLGGMIADRWGESNTFKVCTCVAFLAVLAATFSMPARASRAAAGPESRLRDLSAAWRSPGIRGLLLGCAFPAKLLLTCLCFYLVPIGMQSKGYTSAEIGRLLMVYPLMMVILVPVFAVLADRLGRRRDFVICGGILAGACTGLALIDTSLVWFGILLLMLGVGQAMSITPQSAMMVELSNANGGQKSASVMGLFRLIERSGSAIGPAVGAVLLGGLGLSAAVGAIGVFMIAGTAVYAYSSRSQGR